MAMSEIRERIIQEIDAMNEERLREIEDRISQDAQKCERTAQAHGMLHRGWRFWPPYACSRCGRRITAHQFAFARMCGGCDHSDSRTVRLSIADPRWFILGAVELEDPHADGIIRPHFISSALRYQFQAHPRPHRHLPKRPVPKRWEPIRRKVLGLDS